MDDWDEIRKKLASTGTKRHANGGLEVYHVYPLNDLREHNTDGAECWCNPQYENDLLIHNSMDERESYEQGRKLQ